MTVNVMLDLVQKARVGFLTHYPDENDHTKIVEDGYVSDLGLEEKFLEDQARKDGYNSLPMLVEAVLDIEYPPDHRMPREFYAKRLLGLNALMEKLHEMIGFNLHMLDEFDQPLSPAEDLAKREHEDREPVFGANTGPCRACNDTGVFFYPKSSVARYCDCEAGAKRIIADSEREGMTPLDI